MLAPAQAGNGAVGQSLWIFGQHNLTVVGGAERGGAEEDASQGEVNTGLGGVLEKEGQESFQGRRGNC